MKRSLILLSLLVVMGCKQDDTEDTEDTETEVTCTDADADGVCLEDGDCDDSDALVYPGGPNGLGDIPYNGKDDDCDGYDLCDYDGDGFAKEGEPNCVYDAELQPLPATDCNDGNSDIYPGAEDFCDFTGHDWNCDGEIRDDDCDLDGWVTSKDCDDEDASVYPGAPEGWYDGVDSDCGYDSDFDQDVDSDELEWQADWPDPDWPESIAVWDDRVDEELRYRLIPAPQSEDEWIEWTAGADCDDLDPMTGGGLRELWDGIDRDCDDVIDEMTLRDSWKAYDGSSGVRDGALGSQVALMGDMDGDDFAEFAISGLSSGPGDGYDGRVYVVPTGPEDDRPANIALATIDVSAANQARTWLMGMGMANTGDLNKDRLDDLAVSIAFYDEEGSSAAAVFSGDDLVAGGAMDEGDANAMLTGLGYLGSSYISALGDLNNDRINEVATASWHSLTASVLNVNVFSGVRVGNGGTLDASTGALATVYDETVKGGPVTGGDFDGDGVNELIVGSFVDPFFGTATGGVYLYDGASVREMGIVTAADADMALSGDTCPGSTLGVLEDLDGDGYNELVVGDACVAYSAAGDYGGAVYVIDGDDLASGDLTGEAFITVEAPFAGACMRTGTRHADHDGDGTTDLMVAAPGFVDAMVGEFFESGGADTGYLYWFPNDTVGRGGTFLVSDASAFFRGINASAGFGTEWDVGQVNEGEDSKVDLLVGQPLSGNAYVFINELY